MPSSGSSSGYCSALAGWTSALAWVAVAALVAGLVGAFIGFVVGVLLGARRLDECEGRLTRLTVTCEQNGVDSSAIRAAMRERERDQVWV